MYTDKQEVNMSVLTIAGYRFNVDFLFLFVYYILISRFHLFLLITSQNKIQFLILKQKHP